MAETAGIVRWKRFSADPVTDRSLRHSVRDGIAYSVMAGGGESYLSAYAVFLKATTAQIGWLASLPALVGSIAQLFSAWLGRRLGERRRIVLAGIYLQVAMWPLLLVLPLLLPDWGIPFVILLTVVHYFGLHLAQPQWSSIMGDLVPEHRRGRFFALRSRVATLTNFSALVVAGLLLDLFQRWGNTLAGYVVVFLLAGLARAVSAHHFRQMVCPEGKVAALEIPASRAWAERLTRSRFARFALFYALLQGTVAIASPFFVVYMLRDLEFSYFQLMAIHAVAVLVQFLSMRGWGRVADMFGNRLVMVVAASVIPWMPLLWTFSANFAYLVLLQVIGGFMWAGFSLAAGNYLYDVIPAPKRVTYLAMNNALAHAAIFCGALLGGYLGHALPERLELPGIEWAWASPLFGVFLLSTAARVAVVALFLRRLTEVRSVSPPDIPRLLRGLLPLPDLLRRSLHRRRRR